MNIVYKKRGKAMSKTCPSCNREIDSNITFCNFCGAFAGDATADGENAKVLSGKNIIIGAIAFLFIIAALFLVFVFDIFGLSKKEENLVGRGNSLFAEGLTPVAVSGKWGYADKNGEIVIAPTYEIALPFADKVNGLALVAVKDERISSPYYGVSYDYINKNNEIKASTLLSDAGSFTPSGYAKVGNNNFINSVGEDLLGYNAHRYVSDFTDSGYALAVYDKRFDDKKEGELIPISTSKAYQYQNDYYIIDKSGKELHRFSDFTDDGISDVFDDYFVYFRYAEGHDKELISPREFALADYESGKPVTEFYDRIFKSNDFYIMCSFDEESCLYKAEIYDKDLNKLNDSYYTDNLFKVYDSGLVLYKKSGERFEKVLLNDSLQEVCCENADVTIISGFDKSGIACIKEKDNYVGYNPEGKVFESKFPFGKMNCGLAPFLNNDGKIGFINMNGEIVLGAEYIAVSEFSADGYSTVFCNGSYRIIDTSGKAIIDGLQYPINLIHGNGLDLKWYGNTDFADNVRLMFDDDTISVAAGLFGGKRVNVFGRNADYRLYDKSGKLISGKDSIISDYDSGRLGGYLETVIIESTNEFFSDRYGYQLIDKNSKVIKDSTEVRYIGVPDEYGVVCSKVHTNLDDVNFRCYLEFNNPVQQSGVLYYTEADNGYYLAIGSGVSADVYDHNLNRVSVFPCNLEAEIDRGKVLFYRDVNFSFDWITEDVLNPARSYYVYDYYNGRRVLRLDDTPSGTTSELEVTLTENGFIFCKYTEMADKENILFSQDGKQIATNCEVVADNYKEMVLLKDLSDEKYYFVDRFGNKSEKYEYASGFGTDGYATVRKSDGKYYCVDTYYNDIFSSDKQFKGFCNGLSAYYDEQSGFIGYMDMSGKTAIEPRFHASSDFSYDGYAIAGDDYGRLYIVDKKGNTVIATDGFEGLDSARYINDRELYIHSRYSFENGYKYYLGLDFDEEKKKLFGYGLCDVGDRFADDNMSYLADMYGNLIYGPFEAIGHLMLMPDGTPCFNVRTGFATIRFMGIDGKYLPIDSNLLGEVEMTEKGNILINTRDGYKILDKEYNVIGGPYKRADYLYGYIVVTDENGKTHTLDDNLQEVYNPEELGSWYPFGHDLLIDIDTENSEIVSIRVKSISKNEIVLEKYNCCAEFVAIDKTAYFAISENGSCTLYSYSERDGLKTLIQDVFAGESHAVLGEPQSLKNLNCDKVDGRYIYGKLNAIRHGEEAFYGLFIYDTKTGKYVIKSGWQITMSVKYCDNTYWYVVSYADHQERVMDSSGGLFEPGRDPEEVVPDYLGYTIASGNEKENKMGHDFYYYIKPDGREIANNFYTRSPFRKDGYTRVTMWYDVADNTKSVIIDMYGNVIY